MRLEFTVDTGDAACDVALSAPTATSMATVRAHLVDAGLVAETGSLWCEGQALRPHATLADCNVRTGSVVYAGSRRGVARATELISLDVIGGPAAGQRIGLRTGRVTIGRDSGCDLCLDDSDVSRKHAIIDVTASGLTLTDTGSTNGTSVDGVGVCGPVVLYADQVIRVGDSHLAVTRASGTPAIVREADGRVLVSRPPRATTPVGDVTIDVPRPPNDGAKRRLPVLAALLPAVAGVAFALTMHAPQFLFFALISPLALLATSFGDRVHWRRDQRRVRQEYAAKCAAAETQIVDALAAEQFARRALAPDPVEIEQIARLPSDRLWERSSAHSDLLMVRLALGDAPSTTQVRDGASARPAGTVITVPVSADLRAGPLGIAGPREPSRASAHWAVVQLCTQQSPMLLEVALVLDTARASEWLWARWLPHFRGRIATTPEHQSDLLADLVELANQRDAALATGAGRRWSGPWIVVVVDVASARTELPQLAVLLAQGARIGISAIWLSACRAALPPSCATQAIIDSGTGSRVQVFGDGAAPADGVLDCVSPEWADGVARALAPLRDADGDAGAALPSSCSLLDLLGDHAATALAVAAQWQAADGGCATVLGMTADGPLILDLVRDGPHALVAGTTGSGKSELLQTLVLGLAAAYPPEQMSFLLFDYKGGAAFAECAELPHTAGLVTDLDPQLTRRALETLEAEVRRRERLLADVGAADIDAYRATPSADALPRLILIVDEFASLADELPDFLHGLVSIARRGRSMGVHLVLATQRPGAAVSAEIRANTNIRICLRVTGSVESMEVLGVPDAALIDRSAPGRAVMRIGDSSTLFQTASVGMPVLPADELIHIERLDAWRLAPPPRVTDRHRVITTLGAAIAAAAAASGRTTAARPWCDPLPESLSTRDLAPVDTMVVPIGLVDLPHEQRQDPMTIDLAAGHSLLLAGAARTGRSTALCSIAIQAARQLRQRQLHIYVIDQRGGLSALRRLPHCATDLSGDALPSSAALLQRLASEAERRRQWLSDEGFASVAEAQQAGRSLPSVLLLVDDWEGFTAIADERDAGRTTDLLLALARGGAGIAMTTVVAGGRAALSPRVSSVFTQRYMFAMPDAADFALAGRAQHGMSTTMPSGRALRVTDGADVQFAFSGASPSRGEQDREVAELLSRDDEPAVDAIRIRALPSSAVLGDLPRESNRLVLGVGGDEARPIQLDIGSTASRMLVLGPPRSGRTTTMRTLLAQLDGSAVIVAADRRSALAVDAQRRGVPVVAAHDGAPPIQPRSVVLIDDLELFEDGAATDMILTWSRDPTLSIIATGRTDEVATTYRGIGYQLRRHRCGLLLQPTSVDGDVFGLRLPRHRDAPAPPGRGLLIGAASGPSNEPTPVQVARP